ncbi:MAG TPA: glucose 1-dehydrogenase [Terriglobales bacterium]|jgi:NAD(P)-dependent dehydrogenase (short-subunit alcohol dehydrogenase family)
MANSGLDLTSKTAVVIGGTSGIGHTLALGLAHAGANVVATGRRENLVRSVAEEIKALGRKSLAIAIDVGNRASVEALHTAVCSELGHVDILLNAAGITRKTPSLDVSENEWNQIFDTNLTGTLRACQVFGRKMIERKSGRIINIASVASGLGFFEVAAYAASKAAVVSLTKTLAVEWAKYGVGVNAIAPGVFPTDLNRALLDGTPRGKEFLVRTPMARFGKLEELVGAAVYLASDAASFVTGHVLAVDGGFLASGVNQ